MDDLFKKQLIHERIIVPFNNIGKDMETYFKYYSETHMEGKCRNEGYIKDNTTKVLHYSSGLLYGTNVEFIVVFEVESCMPYEDMELTCIIKNINKIGIRCIIQEENNPMNIFISNEHNSHIDMDKYNELDEIRVKVLGHRFELNDTFISIIAEII
jgi:DNA-directed RNA polymerase subunit E'/Rpb7|tara:strand:- start:249 stop:716 length:468 start_codon:yes stop_codon:yes gene_type:complete